MCDLPNKILLVLFLGMCRDRTSRSCLGLGLSQSRLGLGLGLGLSLLWVIVCLDFGLVSSGSQSCLGLDLSLS